MINTRLFGSNTNTDLGLGRVQEEAPANTQLFASAPTESVNTNLFSSNTADNTVNTVLFAANAVEETSTSNDVQTQFSHLNELLLLEGYTNLATLVAGLSDIYSAGL